MVVTFIIAVVALAVVVTDPHARALAGIAYLAWSFEPNA